MIIGNPITLGGGGKSPIPEFTYTGDWDAVQEDEVNWKIRLLSSGDLTFKKAQTIDAFLVGGGGGGASGGKSSAGGNGGGGGYTTTERNVVLSANTPYAVEIGAGGSKGVSTSSTTPVAGGNGGTTYAFDLSAAGGYGGGVTSTGSHGGSAGGVGNISGSPTLGFPGAFDGRSSYRYYSDNYQTVTARGQGTTTREFGEADGKLYAGGGGAGCGNYAYGSGGGGGMGGGGAGNEHLPSGSSYQQLATGFDGAPNTGGGGGGGGSGSYVLPYGNGGTGGSGVVVIRNAR